MIEEETLLTLNKENQILEAIRKDETKLVKEFEEKNKILYKKLSMTRDSIKFLIEEIRADAKIYYLQNFKSDVGSGILVEKKDKLLVHFPKEYNVCPGCGHYSKGGHLCKNCSGV